MRVLVTVSALMLAGSAISAFAQVPSARHLAVLEPAAAVRAVMDPFLTTPADRARAAEVMEELSLSHTAAIGGDASHRRFLELLGKELSRALANPDMLLRNTAEGMLGKLLDGLKIHLESDIPARKDAARATLTTLESDILRADDGTPYVTLAVNRLREHLPSRATNPARVPQAPSPMAQTSSPDALLGILQGGLRGKSPAERKSALQMAEQAAPVVVNSARAGTSEARKRSESVILSVRGLLADADPEVRRLAARAVGSFNDYEAEAPLKRLLTDENERVRKEASAALEKITGQSAKR
jgi:HEAT repeat protein